MKLRIYKIVSLLALIIAIPFLVHNTDAQSQKADTDIAEALLALQEDESNASWDGTLIGTDTGLFSIQDGKLTQICGDFSVYKIVKGNQWFFMTSQGIWTSEDLVHFEPRNTGLPSLKIKEFTNGEKSFVQQQALLKDLQIHPADPDTLVTLTRDAVFLSHDAGLTWKNLGFSAKTNGAKAVAVCTMPVNGEEKLTVLLAHSIYGLSYMFPNDKNAKWIDIEKGFEGLKGLGSEEIADIITVRSPREDGTIGTDIYISQTFIPCLYKLNWEEKNVTLLAKGKDPIYTIDSLFSAGNRIIYARPDGFGTYDLTTGTFGEVPSEAGTWKYLAELAGPACNSMYIPETVSGFGQPLSFSELWLLNTGYINGKYVTTANNKKALYVPSGKAYPGPQLQKYIDICNSNDLNAIVIDMKDDYGLLRYDSHDPKILEKDPVSSYAIDLDAFVAQCKESNLYLVARIVSFKDKVLWKYQNGKYAVRDSSTGEKWQGIRRTNEDGTIEYYDEYWVDPYCEEVWEYNVAIAQELISRGFDEIQFDYIRFPTDGNNLSRATYPWKDKGMDMESALMSFLRYARANINVPIGIDIYGANGWNRSGTRTGQDVEMLSQYVDVICPMFYPSHFDQNYLDYSPAAERPYRIYYYGCYRNTVIARNRVIVRPWVQAFYLAVSYDKKYYDKDYVTRQIYGTRDSIDRGYMYWNNSGRYDDISKDPGDDDPYPWKDEGAIQRPALGFNPAVTAESDIKSEES